MIIITSMTSVDSSHPVLSAESRSMLLTLLREAGQPLSVTEAAERLGLQASTTRHHLDLLVSAGLVDRSSERRMTAGRRRIRYAAAGPVDEAASRHYEGLAGVLADQLTGTPDPIGAAHEAGRRWTGALGVRSSDVAMVPEAAIEAVVDLMDHLGFAPDRPSGDRRINLRSCPFEAVARQQRGIVCGVHAGMLEETFRRVGGTVEVKGLDAFAVDEPLLCVVHLRTVPAGPTRWRGEVAKEDNQPSTHPGGATVGPNPARPC